MAEKLLEVKNLSTQFRRDKSWITAVNDVSFHINKGEILGLVGESGCGKSVTSLSIMRLLPPEMSRIPNGEVIFNGDNILEYKKADMRSIRGHKISMIFQEPMNSLNPCMRIERQLTEAILLHNKISKAEAKDRAKNALRLVGIPEIDTCMSSYPHQLSGGMCQRVMIAMAMSCEPDLLIADEPTTALDVTIQAQILELMEEIRQKKNTSILMITHDLGVVASMCSRVIVMYAGKVVEEARVKDLFEKPMHPYTKGLIASVPKLYSNLTSLPSIPGSVPDLSAMPTGCRFAPRCNMATDKCREVEPELIAVDDTKERFVRCHMVDTDKEVR